MSYSLAFSQAIAIVAYIAIKNEHGIYDFVPSKELASNLNIAGPTAVKILQGLSRAGLIETREGARGGVRLASASDTITLLDVFSAIEQERPLFRVDQRLRIEDDMARQVLQRVLAAVDGAEQEMKQRLQQVTIADLYR